MAPGNYIRDSIGDLNDKRVLNKKDPIRKGRGILMQKVMCSYLLSVIE